ncbi:MAG: SLC13 family permease, partial [Armatimonadota bacterium]
HGMPAMGMFELAPLGVPIALAGLAYMWLLGRRLIPERVRPGELGEQFGLRPYLTEVLLLPESKLIGKTLAEAGFGLEMDLTVLRVLRNGKYLAARGATRLQEGDVLLVEGQREQILKVKETSGIEIEADVEHALPGLESDEVRLVEVILMPRAPLIGRTLKNTRFRERYNLQVLAINRHEETLHRKLSDVRLRMGDVLLVQGHPDHIGTLDGQSIRILGPVENGSTKAPRAPMAILIFAGVLAAATFNLFPLATAVLLGAVLVFVTRCLTPEEAYRDVEWKVVIIIGSMLALGSAMDHSGTAQYLASSIISLLEGAHPLWLLTVFFVLTVLLTQPMSNQAAAIVVLPIAFQVAQQLDLNARTFAIMIAAAASCSYLTPLEPSCLMVYGPGRYRFLDFVKVGALLTILIYVIAIVLVPRIWPL